MRIANPALNLVPPAPTTPASQPTAEAVPAKGLEAAIFTKPLAEKKLAGHSLIDSFSDKRPLGERGVDATQSNQLNQIADGVRNGTISAGESQKLLTEQQGISDATRSAVADGKLSLDERRKLNLMQTLAGMNISEAGEKGIPDLGIRLKEEDGSRQAGQIDTLAEGISNGNITNSEASKLLGKQADISEARGPSLGGDKLDTLFDKKPLNKEGSLERKLDAADRDLARHGKPGTQLAPNPNRFPDRIPGAIMHEPLNLRDDALPLRTEKLTLATPQKLGTLAE
ncbi:hypothetical protein [Hyalangium gracile]|uniref:hypothetical protein n=1 Tax=Hyalangium gracile TaxID=394092 RepID=UPI001CCFB73E|nr:hypothetical protein [Hyalangium gracile]